MSFSTKYANLSLLRVREESHVFSREGFTRDKCYLHEGHHYVRSSSCGVSRNNVKAELDSTPLGWIAACHKAGRIQNESFTQLFPHFVCFMKLSKRNTLSWLWMVTIFIRDISRWYTVIGKIGCTLFSSLAEHSLTATTEIFRHATPEYNLRRGDRNLAEKPFKQSCYTLSNY